MARYTFHFASDLSDPYRLTCGRLAQTIADRFRDANPGQILHPFDPQGYEDTQDSDTESASDDEGAAAVNPALPGAPPAAPEPGDPANLHNASYWEAVRQFQWALKSDRTINARAVSALIADLQTDGLLEAARQAFRRLSAALVAAYPGLAEVEKRDVVQLVALGNEMAMAAAESPDLFAYVKNELQTVNLAALLRV